MVDNANDPARDIFLKSLRTLRTFEAEALAIMCSQIDRADDHRAFQSRLALHRDETRRQIERLDAILDSIDAYPSLFKSISSFIFNTVTTMKRAATSHDIMTDALCAVAIEHLEIASYRSLIIMAQTCGKTDAVPLLQQSLSEEMAMADWLQQNLPNITDRYLAQLQA